MGRNKRRKSVDRPARPVVAGKPKMGYDELGVAALVCIVLVCYASVFQAGFIWDDNYYVTENRHVADPDGLRAIWFDRTASPQYYPLVFTTFWIEYRLWGLNPVGYHVVNVLLHAAGVVLLWILLRRLSVPGAWLAAAIVAVHPMHVESVAWVTELKNVLAVVFALLTALAYFRFDPPTPERVTRQWSFFPLVLATFVCALLSKSTTAMLPGALLAILWWKRDQLDLVDVAPLAATALLGLAAGLNTAWLEVRHVGATGMEWSLSVLERLMLAGCASWFYVGKLVWPTDIAFIYPRWTIEIGRWWLFIFPILAVAMIAGLWLARKRIGKGALAAVLVYGVTLFPAMGFLDVYPMRYSYVANHFAYPATMALIALASAGAAVTFARFRRTRPIGSGVIATVSILVVMIFAFLSIRHEAAYRNRETLWRMTLATNPHALPANIGLAEILVEQERSVEAETLLRQAIKDEPFYPESYNNLATIYTRRGQQGEAIRLATRAIALMPQMAMAYVTRAIALTELGKLSEAEQDFHRAIERNPNFAPAYLNLGVVYFHKGQRDAELNSYNKAIELDPGMSIAYQNRALIYQERKEWAKAEADLAAAKAANRH